jgi:hypothetical protein
MVDEARIKKSPPKMGGLNPYQWRHGGDSTTVPKLLVQRNISPVDPRQFVANVQHQG